MKLKCVLRQTDFVPMIKTPRFWISPETLKEGSILVVEPAIGHQLLAAYPAAFHVVSYEDSTEEKPKTRNKRMPKERLVEGESVIFECKE